MKCKASGLCTQTSCDTIPTLPTYTDFGVVLREVMASVTRSEAATACTDGRIVIHTGRGEGGPGVHTVSGTVPSSGDCTNQRRIMQSEDSEKN